MTFAQMIATWIIASAAIFGVIVRPWRLPEALWAVAGAVLLVAFGLLPVPQAVAAIGEGGDVYLFLAGMMLLSEIARKQGLFDWLAAHAVAQAGGSPSRLFVIVYGVGLLVTVFMSNDATAVVLTPAVYAATKKARVEPLPYLMACAFIANAASFVLPISNPANLVVYGSHTPALGAWMTRFALPACLSIAATFFMLRWIQRHALCGKIDATDDLPPLPRGGGVAALGIAFAGGILLFASAIDLRLGIATFVCGFFVTGAVLLRARANPWPVLRDVSWLVLPLVAGLFVIVEALNRSGLLRTASAALAQAFHSGGGFAAAVSGAFVALICNLANNLPVGLVVGAAAKAAQAPPLVRGALLLGVDIGPNLSVTGSLATILWLIALRREGLHVSAGRFLAIGAFVMPAALVLALAALVAQPW